MGGGLESRSVRRVYGAAPSRLCIPHMHHG